MVIERGEVRWAELGSPNDSSPGYRRPVVVVSADSFTASRINTVTVAAISSNTRLGDAPGNVPLESGEAGLPKQSVINVSQIVTIDKGRLGEAIGRLSLTQLDALDNGLRLALGLAS